MSEYKLVVLGAVGVGKSALVIQLTNNHFVVDYDPTIEDSYRKRVCIDEEPCLLDILDAADPPSEMGQVYMRQAQGFLLVFALNNRESFTAIPSLHAQVVSLRQHSGAVVCLVGNKQDLADGNTATEGPDHQRAVSTREAHQLAEVQLLDGYVETSAKTGNNVANAFYELVRQIRRVQWPVDRSVVRRRSKCLLS